jgi:hypothetical protein
MLSAMDPVLQYFPMRGNRTLPKPSQKAAGFSHGDECGNYKKPSLNTQQLCCWDEKDILTKSG